MENKAGIRRAVIAAQIKEAMALKGWSRKQLADQMGRRPSEVTKWLSGDHNFTIDLLSEISVTVGVPISGIVNVGDSGLESCSTGGVLRSDSSVNYGKSCSVGPIVLPQECYNSLQCLAQRRGEDLGTFVKSLLLREAVRPVAKASAFCGIWSDEDFGMTVDEQIADIKSHRSGHRKIEEL